MLPCFHFSIERWRKNEEYGVWVSTLGRIRLIKNKEFLNVRINPRGYCVVFTDKGIEYVHRLVAYTWLGGKRNDKYNIDHINSNKRDNSVRNLRWIERELNEAYARYTETTVSTADEPRPISTIEHSEDLIKQMNNRSLSAEKRGQALIELMEEHSIEVYYDGNKVEEINDALRCQLGVLNTQNTIFACRIANAVINNAAYCNKRWTIKIIKDDLIK